MITCIFCNSSPERKYVRCFPNVYRCSRCGLWFRFPQFLEAPQQMYAGLVSRGKMISVDTSLIHYAQFLKPLLPPLSTVLDFGGGVGKFARLLETMCSCKVINYEPMNEARNIAESSGVLAVDNIEDLAEVDAVTLIEVLEHLPDPRGALRQVFKKIKNGGILFLTTPNADALAFRLKGAEWGNLRKESHLFLYKQRHVTAILEEAGFSSIQRITNPPRLSGRKLLNGFRYMLDFVGVGGGIRFLARKSVSLDKL